MLRFLESAINIAKKSGDFIVSHLEDEKIIELKGISNLVTSIDKESEKLIIKCLEENFPDHSILSEERGFLQKKSDYTWIIDPLDGTTNYAHRFPFFGVSIALKYNEEIILGVIYDPIRKELFFALKNEGAYLNDKKVAVSKTKNIADALISTGMPYELTLDEKNFLPFINLSSRAHGIRRAGSAALEIAYVACGRLDGFWARKLKPWDIAAGIILVKEAGGKVTDFNGNDIQLDDDTFLASNGLIHDNMLEIIKLERIVIKK